jgi:phage shock protein E
MSAVTNTNGSRGLGLAALAVAAVSLLAACGSDDGVEAAGSGVRVVSVDEAASLLAAGDRTVIDVRTPQEFAGGHLAGARMIDIQGPTFDQEIRALDPNDSYIIYCRTANRSAGARQLMTELGFVDVVDIAGGVVAWSEAGLPLEN